MIKLFLDIETIPCTEEQKESYVEIIQKLNSKKEKTAEDIYEETSFEGTFGRICCIGIIKEGDTGILRKAVYKGTEKEILTKFWQEAANVHRFIGHNLWAFDLPFIYKRSIINGVKPRWDINFARYRNMPIYDTQQEWELWGFGRAQKLDTLAKVLGLPSSKGEMDGSLIWKYYQDGKIDQICKYCMRDVELTRQVYYKMTFENPAEESSEDIPF